MNYRKWETIKTKAITALVASGVDRQKAEKEIEHYDVRQVGVLVKRFPSSIPATWRGRMLKAEMADNANSDWVVYPA